MKKFINKPEDVVEEMIEGMTKAHPDILKRLEGYDVIIRKESPIRGKVGLVSGGGSGHEPAHGGFVGKGMLDAAVFGGVFHAPKPDQILQAIKAVDGGAGVLLIIKNYRSDVANFEAAAEMAERDGVRVSKVIVDDDVAIDESMYAKGRRGIAGTIFVHKIAGAAAENGLSLSEVTAVAEEVIQSVRSLGVSLTACVVPEEGKPSFALEDDAMEIGLGIHGEPGRYRVKLEPADEIVDHILYRILKDYDYTDSRVAVLVNGLGCTPLMELYIMNNRLSDMLGQKGIVVAKTIVGNYMTSLEMAGASISVLKVDDRMLALLDEPVNVPSY